MSVCKLSSSEDGKKQNQSVNTHCISETFHYGIWTKGQKCLRNRLPTFWTISQFQHICGWIPIIYEIL